MDTIRIIPSILRGIVNIPPSKSISHRAIICGALSSDITKIENIYFSEDIDATLNGVISLGAKLIYKEKNKYGSYNIAIKGTNGQIAPINNVINCNESGSTLRFLIPFAGLSNTKMVFNGKGNLIKRPLDTYYKIFQHQNIKYYNNRGLLPLTIDGMLKPDIFKVKGDISSQFITGLLFSLPLLNGDSKIIMTTELESKAYVALTLELLKIFSIDIKNIEYKEFHIKGNQAYKSTDYKVEGDFSQAAFWLSAGLISDKIQCIDLNKDSIQGDKSIVHTLKHMGGIISDNYIAEPSNLTGIEFDGSQHPDLVPIIATIASVSQGTTIIKKASRLRIKESDRLKAISTELNNLGANIKELDDGLIIMGKKYLNGGLVHSWNDHRIAMSLAIAAIKCKNPVFIKGASAVKKSYPNFWDDYKMLGGNINEWN